MLIGERPTQQPTDSPTISGRMRRVLYNLCLIATKMNHNLWRSVLIKDKKGGMRGGMESKQSIEFTAKRTRLRWILNGL